MKRQRPYVGYRKVYHWLIKYVVIFFICALLGLSFIFIYLYTQHLHEPVLIPTISQREESIFERMKFVHLDLKGAPPKMSYYEFFFPLLASVGANGIVIEYEDMFPFEGSIVENISALNAYTRDNIRLINDLAKANKLEIIPLVQTFGHLEFVLKLEKFQHLREVPEFPQELCPSNENSIELVIEMVTQVIEAHPNSKIIHIGADDARYAGRCRHCINNMRVHHASKEELYLKYIRTIRDYILLKYPQLTVLIWDDQLRYLSEEEIRQGINDSGIIPVVRQYDTDVFDKLGPSLWSHYANLFPKVWIASAFKGAAGVDEYIVNVAHYTQNHRSWVNIIESYKYLVNIEAIILTGWQRYDHFSMLCELLPVALPSLIINLEILDGKEGNSLEPSKRVAEILKCQQPYALMGPSFGTPKCSFQGSEILENVYRLHQLKEDFDEFKKKSKIVNWVSEMDSPYYFSSPEHTSHIAAQSKHFKEEVNEIEKDIYEALLEVYDEFTIDEWVMTYIKPLRKQIYQLWNAQRSISARRIWPRRWFKAEIPP